jgi:hypothetical protein
MGKITQGGMEEKACELYGYGMSDGQIADRCDVSLSAVKYWRYARRLPANKPVGSQTISRAEHAKRLQLYRLKWTDGAIGKACGVKHNAIFKWRVTNDLPPHCKFQEKGRKYLHLPANENDRREALYRRGASDTKIGLDVGRSAHAIKAWREQRGLPPNLAEPKWDRPATKLVSMDADLGEGGFNRHALVADDAAAAWLEEMGATVW